MNRPVDQFPVNIKTRAYHIYPRKGVVVVDGSTRFSLAELAKTSLNIRLSLPPDLFAAIHKAGNRGGKR